MNARGEKGLSLSLHVPFLLREAPVRMRMRRRGMIGCSPESSTPQAARKPPNGRASGVAEALRSRRNAASAGYGTAARGRERSRLEPCEQAGECERREHASADDRLPALHSAERHALAEPVRTAETMEAPSRTARTSRSGRTACWGNAMMRARRAGAESSFG